MVSKWYLSAGSHFSQFRLCDTRRDVYSRTCAGILCAVAFRAMLRPIQIRRNSSTLARTLLVSTLVSCLLEKHNVPTDAFVVMMHGVSNIFVRFRLEGMEFSFHVHGFLNEFSLAYLLTSMWIQDCMHKCTTVRIHLCMYAYKQASMRMAKYVADKSVKYSVDVVNSTKWSLWTWLSKCTLKALIWFTKTWMSRRLGSRSLTRMCARTLDFPGDWPLAAQDCMDKTTQTVGKGQESDVEAALEDKVCLHARAVQEHFIFEHRGTSQRRVCVLMCCDLSRRLIFNGSR